MKLILAFTAIIISPQAFPQQQDKPGAAREHAVESYFPATLISARSSYEKLEEGRTGDSAYISAASRLASTYYAMVKFDSALVYFEKACEAAKMRYGVTSVQYGNLLVKVAMANMELGRYREAEQGFQHSAAILKKEGGAYNKDAYSRCLSQQAGFYILTGSLNKAEELCQEASKIALKEPVNIGAYSMSLEKLDWLYEKLGFYSKQEEIVRRIFDIQKSFQRENSLKYANATGMLAAIYQRHNKLVKADSLFEKALEIRRQTFGKRSAANIGTLNRLGVVNTKMRKYRQAEKYLKEAVEIARDNNGEGSPLYAYCAKNLAGLYALSGRKKLAEPLFQKCLAIYHSTNLELNSGCLNLLHDMAELLYAGDPSKAAVYLKEAMETENTQLLNKLDFLSETELLDYLKGIEAVSESPYRFLAHYKNPVIAGAAYNRRLLASGVSLQNTRVLYQNMAQSKDSVLATCWKNYLQQKSAYTNLLSAPAAQRNVDMDSVSAILNSLEKDILRRSAEYRNMKEKLSLTWHDLQKHLQPNEAAIEFIRFNGASNAYGDAGPDTAYYAALLLRPQDTAPRFVVLCEERKLVSAVNKFPYKAAVNTRGGKLTGNGMGWTSALYRLLWQPLTPYLKHAKRIYYSPDGILHRVAFAAIPYEKGELLCDKFDLVQLMSTRQIALQETRPPASVAIAMFGGINYNRQSADAGAGSYGYPVRGDRSAGPDSFRFLPHTLTEINTIKTDVEALQRRSLVFTGDKATEAAFRSLAGDRSPEVIHFATHGFTLPDTPDRITHAGAPFRASCNPLLRCGLIMAGGNIGWKGDAGLNEDDGVLTGLEISSIQLPHTRLAVLSACETGLGKIEGSEGVFGLQRAFKLAGVHYVMATLWQVPDKETAEFMEVFYTQWLGGRSIRQAFSSAQQVIRKKHPPYYWAGFTLVQ
jgi:CHAT domain-containing protein